MAWGSELGYKGAKENKIMGDSQIGNENFLSRKSSKGYAALTQARVYRPLFLSLR